MSGYFRFPTLANDQIVFVCEDDLWTVSSTGGLSQRLTSGLGRVDTPSLSPDGKYLAYASTEEGQSEIYFMPPSGGEPKRATYLGANSICLGWSPQNELIIASDYGQPFSRIFWLHQICPEMGELRKLSLGPALHLSYGPNGERVLARNSSIRAGAELAYWKRYRGGTAGEIWIDSGEGHFEKVMSVNGNSARPFWINNRIYFISDHENFGNIYSINSRGGDIKRHTKHKDFYVRGLNSDGKRLVYQSGGDLYLLDPKDDESVKIEIDHRSPQTQVNRKFVSAYHHLEDYELHPKTEQLVISARGKVFSFDAWKGAVHQHGETGAMRYRLGRFMPDGNRVVVVSDAGGEEAFEIHHLENRQKFIRLSTEGVGRAIELKVSPVGDEALVTNHRNELIWVNLETGESKTLDRSYYTRIYGFNWSPDGKYVAYSCSENQRLCAIRICEIATGRIERVTRPVLQDVSPFFDPLGDFLYFISYREFDPVYDNLHFDLSFPRGSRPYVLNLRKNTILPFSPDYTKKRKPLKDGEIVDLKIDFDGIEDRIAPLPVPDGRYGQIAATSEKIFFTKFAIEGSLRSTGSSKPAARAFLECYDIAEEKVESIVGEVSNFRLSQDGKTLIYRAGNDLRVLKAGEKPVEKFGSDYGKKTGWVDISRAQIPIRPREEWRQMYREAWRLQRDQFWNEDMSKVDWQQVYDRYLPLLDRVASRSELSDLLWEVQGELGTSHAYEFGGDYRSRPSYNLGFLGADWKWDDKTHSYSLTDVIRGDLWDPQCSSPLARAGVELKIGDRLISIDGQTLTRNCRPEFALVHKSGTYVSISFVRKGSRKVETRSVRTLRSEIDARYREWVERNRKIVHEKSRGRVGYVHIPDMSAYGYAEFHRSYLQELDREGLIIDVRYNGGGHVSQLILEKLARRRIGFVKTRWFGVQPYPTESPAGPMVAITNEFAGSDGDIFSHSFKLLKLGPLLGKRTWGGVIGVNPSHALSDGSVTTQPEYSFWFEDVGGAVENYGAEPDIVVEYPPDAYLNGRDPQLLRGIELVQSLIHRAAPANSRPGPDLSLPDLTIE